MPRAERRAAGGFTLVEVLVALVVASLLLTIVMNGVLAARQRRGIVTEQTAAVSLAQTLFADAAVRAFRAGEDHGSAGALHWQRAEAALAVDPRGLYVLSRIDVRIADARRRTLFAASSARLKAVGTP